MMTTILLIRHGMNEFVGKGKLAGWLPGIHLNEKGIAQAKALADLLKPVKLRAVYSSPLERAVETARPIAKAQGLKVVRREGLGEIRYGSWQGQSLKALRRRKLWPLIQGIPSLARFPEGESFPEAQARVVAELEALRSHHKRKKDIIACVFHSDPIKLAIAHYIGMPLDLFQRLIIDPASINILHIGDGHTHLIRLNDTRATTSVSGG
jgi:probable phosphomutase (TIGR03848 family)